MASPSSPERPADVPPEEVTPLRILSDSPVNAASLHGSPRARDVSHFSGASEFSGGADSPEPIAPEGGNAPSIAIREMQRHIRKLERALREAEEKAARDTAAHKREMELLRDDYDMSVHDRGQLERIAEEARAEAAHAASSLKAREEELAQVAQLKTALASEADATRRAREDHEAARQEVQAAESRAAKATAALGEKTKELEAVRGQLAVVGEAHRRELAEADQLLDAATQQQRDYSARIAVLERDLRLAQDSGSPPRGKVGDHSPRSDASALQRHHGSPAPNVPALAAPSCASSAAPSPDDRFTSPQAASGVAAVGDTAAGEPDLGSSFVRYRIEASPDPGAPQPAATATSTRTRAWRQRNQSMVGGVPPTPQGSVVRPEAGDTSNEHSPLLQHRQDQERPPPPPPPPPPRRASTTHEAPPQPKTATSSTSEPKTRKKQDTSRTAAADDAASGDERKTKKGCPCIVA